MKRIISFHQRPPKELGQAFIVSEILAAIGLVVILLTMIAIATIAMPLG